MVSNAQNEAGKRQGKIVVSRPAGRVSFPLFHNGMENDPEWAQTAQSVNPDEGSCGVALEVCQLTLLPPRPFNKRKDSDTESHGEWHGEPRETPVEESMGMNRIFRMKGIGNGKAKRGEETEQGFHPVHAILDRACPGRRATFLVHVPRASARKTAHAS
jgi:hypothetical protein